MRWSRSRWWPKTRRRWRGSSRRRARRGAVLYTAYNHRFEPHFVRMRDLVKSGALGTIYRCRMFYGNGTARLVRNSDWRDQGAGVLADLGSHVLDTARFWFGDIGDEFSHRLGRPLREPQPRSRRFRGDRAAARGSNSR